MPPEFIYKIFRPHEWESLQAARIFAGSADDLRDGFIHFSTSEQLAGTLAKYYTDGADIVLAEVRGEALGDTLKYEISRGGDAFPHLYAPLHGSAINRNWVIAANAYGGYVLPELKST
jgi:uncharacterized protein (DUF952 family)